jgi:DNA polymerase-3 subunit gamma/tau
VGQDAVVTTLKNALRFDKIAHAYLFSGSRGVGKTTLARLFAKALNCLAPAPDHEPCNQCPSCLDIASGQSLDVIEIDGASNRGIDDIRQINETVGYAPSHGRYKIYIIDEVHMLTKEAFNALLKTLEEPPERAKFFFATTEPHKVLPTIISRCQRFDLGRILPSQIIAKLEQIATDLQRSVDAEALHHIAAFSDGSLRDAESLFDQILCFTEETVTSDAVRHVLGLVSETHFFALDQAFSESRLAYAFELVDHLFQAGKDLAHFLEQLIEHYRLLTLSKTVGEQALPALLAPRYAQSTRLYTQGQTLYLLEYLLAAEPQLQKSVCQRVSLEAILLHVIRSKNRVPVEVLVRRLSELEETLLNRAPPPVNEEIPLRTPVVQAPPPVKVMASQSPPPVKTEIPLRTPIDRAPPPVKVVASPPPVKEEQTTVAAPQSPPPAKEERSVPAIPPSPLSAKEEILLTLQRVPFNPYRALANTPPELPPFQAAGAPQVAGASPTALPVAKKHVSHYDTLMRFAAVELEGSFKIN